MKRILIGTVALIMAMPAYADDKVGDKTTTSLPYVDAQVALKQGKIPAAGAQGAAAGESVITYTSTAGTIGERGIYSDASSYTANTDADKLITAGALKAAFTLPTTDTTTLECANQSGGCTLWTIVDQTAYGVSVGGNACWLPNEHFDAIPLNTDLYIHNPISGSTDDPTYGLSNGEWVMLSRTKYTKGIAQCSQSMDNPDVGANSGYEDYFCWCKITETSEGTGVCTQVPGSWVFSGTELSDYEGDCLEHCAEACAYVLWDW